MTEARHSFDAAVVGAGPSGLFAALELARSGKRVVLLEAGGDFRASLCGKVRRHLNELPLRDAERFRFQCPRCTCLTGLGGAAFHFDTTLGYFKHLSRSKIEAAQDEGEPIRRYSGLERALGTFERAQDLIRDVYRLCFDFGLPGEHVPEDDSFLRTRVAERFTHVDTAPSQPVTVRDAMVVIGGITSEMTESGSTVALNAPVTRIEDASQRRWRLSVTGPDFPQGVVDADFVVLAVGKCAMPWVTQVVADLDIAYEPARHAHIGTRIETELEDLDPIVRGCHNPKIAFLNDRSESVRTFCVTRGGRLMQYEFCGVPVLEGQHCLELSTQRSNIGIVTTVDVPDGRDGADYALEIGRRVAEHGDGAPVVQTVGDLLAGRSSSGAAVDTSLVAHHAGDLRECFPGHLVDDFIRMTELLNDVSPGVIDENAVVAAPVIERVYPDFELTHDMQTSREGVYFVGDCSSKIIGVTYGAATGLAAARAIAAN